MRFAVFLAIFFSLSAQTFAAPQSTVALDTTGQTPVMPAGLVGSWERISISCLVARTSTPNTPATIKFTSDSTAFVGTAAPQKVGVQALDGRHGSIWMSNLFYAFQLNDDSTELTLSAQVFYDDNPNCAFNDIRQTVYKRIK